MTTPADVRAEAIDLVQRRGISINAAAARVGVNRSTLMRWLRKVKEGAPPSHAVARAAPAPAAPPTPSATAGARAEDLTRRGLDHALAMAERAIEDGNLSAAGKAIRDALGGANNLARIEKTQRDREDGIFFSREQIDRTRKAMVDRVAALAADLERTGGLRCGECGRKIRLELASARDEATL